MTRSREAAQAFLASDRSAADQFAVFTDSETVTQDFTSDRDAVSRALTRLRSHPRMDLIGYQCPGFYLTPDQAYAIVEHTDPNALILAYAQAGCPSQSPPNASVNAADATLLRVQAMAESIWDQTRAQSQIAFTSLENVVAQLARRPGSRTLLITSAGFLNQTLEPEQNELVDHAIRSGVIISGLDPKGLVADADEELPGGLAASEFVTQIPARLRLPSGEVLVRSAPPTAQSYWDIDTGAYLARYTETMAELAQATGGRLFWNSNSLDTGYAQLAAAPETSYILSFTPDRLAADGHFHRLEVKLTSRRGDSVQARKGYYAPTPPDPRAELIRQAVAGADTKTGIPIAIRTQPQPGHLRVVIEVGVNGLSFTSQGGRHQQQLTIAAVLKTGPDLRAGERAEVLMHLSDPAWQQLKHDGVQIPLDLAAPAGAYQLRVVVCDATGKLAAVAIPASLR